MSDINEETLKRRQLCFKQLSNRLNDHMNEVYLTCDIWSETGEGDIEDIFSKVSQ